MNSMIKKINPKLKIIISVVTWGSLGLFVRNINLTSIEISFFRALIGSLFLLSIILIRKEAIDKKALRENLLYLSISGLALGTNWSALFQAIKYTTIANATLSYYFAPIFIVVFSSIILKEKMTIKNIACILISILGLFMILKTSDNKALNNYDHTRGVIFGLFGAVLYAGVVISNKFIKGLSSLQITLSQLAISALVLFPIVFRKGLGNFKNVDLNSWILVIILGIIHTGIAYLLYFPSLKDVKAQSIGILSYLDPITAILLSSIFLKEPMSIIQYIGGGLILVSAYINEKN